jgi:Zn ribbon nucleic-acid-binding protein
MKCPRCNMEHTRLSWLREFIVIYWCTECNAGFEINRHRSRLTTAARNSHDHEAVVEPPLTPSS